MKLIIMTQTVALLQSSVEGTRQLGKYKILEDKKSYFIIDKVQ